MTDLTSRIEVAMGGKAAEEIVYGVDKVTTGVSAVSFSRSPPLHAQQMLTRGNASRTSTAPQEMPSPW
jgi:ATP-dependent Zn protease